MRRTDVDGESARRGRRRHPASTADRRRGTTESLVCSGGDVAARAERWITANAIAWPRPLVDPSGAHSAFSRHARAKKSLQIGRADGETRTPDPFITSEVLYQLSYVGRVAAETARLV